MDNPDEEINPFAFLPISIDSVQLNARPIEFEFDKEEKPCKAIKWESVHPNTGQMLQFGMENLTLADDGIYYYSDEPISGEAKQIISQVVGRSLPKQDNCPFQDPIEMGLLKI